MLGKLFRTEFGSGRSQSVIMVVTLDRSECHVLGPVIRDEPDALAGPKHLEVIEYLEVLIASVGRKWRPLAEVPGASETQVELLAGDIAAVRKFGRRIGPQTIAIGVRKP